MSNIKGKYEPNWNFSIEGGEEGGDCISQKLSQTRYGSMFLLLFFPDRVKRYLTFNLIHVNSGYKCVCETVPKSLFWAPSCVPGFEYMPQLAC